MKYKNLISALFLFFLQVLVFAYVFCYLFPFKEQFQMFQFTKQYAVETCRQAGGVALYISGFLSQFYINIWSGPVITAALLTLLAILSSLILRKISTRDDLPVIFLLPWFSLMIIHFDYEYLEQGTIAYLIHLLSLWLYVNLTSKARFIYAICIIPFLYLTAGPIVHLFAVSAVLFEFLTNGKKKYISIVYLPVAAVTAIVGCYSGYSRNLVLAFSPNAYYNLHNYNLQVDYSWYAFGVAMLLTAFLRKYNPPVSLRRYYWISAQWIIILLLGYKCIRLYGRLDTLDQFEQDYFVRTGQWDRIISGFDQTTLSKRRMCNLNLALAQTGQLSGRLMEYPQKGIETLMLPWDQTVFTAELHSDLYYCMGIISASQKFAFEAWVSSHSSGNPRMLKRLVETNLATGAYPVAEKYIGLLENTWHYKDWATAHRRFLYNDQAVENDSVLGLKRRCWQTETLRPETYTDPVTTLLRMLPSCPENQAGLQYLTSFLLLNKDLKTYSMLQDSLYRTPAWKTMTGIQQEAVVICNPSDPHYWLEHGVSVQVRNRAIKFMQKVQEDSRFGQNPAVTLAEEYGKTYWYYYMFNTMGK